MTPETSAPAVSGSAPTRREQQTATRRDLLDAAARVFAAEGYHGASVDAVAAAAGYTKGAVYSNFRSKEQLFLALLDRQIDQAVAVLEQVLADAAPETRTRVVAERHDAIDALDRDWFLLEAEFLLYAARNDEVRELLAARQRRTHGRIAELLGRHLADLGLEVSRARVADLARIVLATADGLTQETLIHPALEPDSGRLLGELLDALAR